MHPLLTTDLIHAFHTDCVTLIRGMFADCAEPLRDRVAFNLKHPGPYNAENLTDIGRRRFFDDYYNWARLPEFSDVIHSLHIAQTAAELIGSNTVQLFHEHVLIKEPGTSKPMPWHSDAPFYFTADQQNIGFWVHLDPVKENSLRVVAGSHNWQKLVLPTRWLSEQNFYPDSDLYQPVPDPDAEGMSIIEYNIQPGDAIAFHFNALHGARGNHSTKRRRAFLLRLLEDNARYIERPGPTSPPFPGHAMQPGQRLSEDWFPILLDQRSF